MTIHNEPQTGMAMPEWLTRDDTDPGAWVVHEGPATRGEAWTSIHDRIMRVPFGGDETNRLIRAHEMMHAKVSPQGRFGTELGISDDALQAAEEFRVNTLVGHAGFDLDALVDGSERLTGQRLAQASDYRNLVLSIAAMAGGKAAKDLLRGVRNVDPALAKTLRQLEKRLLKEWKNDVRGHGAARAARKWARTSPVGGRDTMAEYPQGYAEITIPIARALDDLTKALKEKGHEPEPEEGGEDTEQGEFDPKIADDVFGRHIDWADEVRFGHSPLPRKVRGTVGRKRIAANTGINPRRMTRMLTDPQRRVFDRTLRTNGGIVVIDLSGSMSLSPSELDAMMEASPGCTIVGYSQGDRGEANAWVLARDGRRCETLPGGGRGNGIDGPIMEWAIDNAKRNEPIVWVCDGIVTGKHDQCAMNLDLECAALVRRHGIHMAYDVPEGVKAMQALAKGKKLPTTYTGNVRTAAKRLGFVR
jgi:hypothetical protein